MNVALSESLRELIASLEEYVDSQASSDCDDLPDAINGGHYVHDAVKAVEACFTSGKLPADIRGVWMDLVRITRGKTNTVRPNQDALDAVFKLSQWATSELNTLQCRSDECQTGQQPPAAPAKKPKRSTERGEGRAKLVAALTQHHKYADGGCLNLEPIGNNELARLSGVDRATASAFFKQQFKGHGKYKAACRDAGRLAAALKLLNGEFAPHLLYGGKPANEDERDEG